jgi:hypothetical protein
MPEDHHPRSPASFLALPLDTTPARSASIGPDDENYFLTQRYLDSCPVIITLPTPRAVVGRGLVTSFRSDGIYLWDDLDHADVLSPTTRYKPALVRVALARSGVCTPIGADLRNDLLVAIREILG